MDIEIFKQILASDIISWFFAAIGGALAYLVLHRMQNTIERQCMIKEIEDTISRLMDKKLALKRKVKPRCQTLSYSFDKLLRTLQRNS